MSPKSLSPHPLTRCPWPVENDPLYIHYHDEEWGVPVQDDKKIYEFLLLESFQAGLSWRTVLHKRENFKKSFANFDFNRVARFGARDQSRLLKNKGIIRNRAKIQAAIHNARMFLNVRQSFGRFSKYMWSWVKGRPLVHSYQTLNEYPRFTEEALSWSRDLKKRGFNFLGPTVVYSHMQAMGMVNDHTVNCFRYSEINKSHSTIKFLP